MAGLVVARATFAASWSGAMQQQYDQISLLWFHVHQATAIRLGRIEFTHVSKCGGTSMCQLAMRNKCSNSYSSEMQNCIVGNLQDAPLWVVPFTVNHSNHHTRLKPYNSYDCPVYIKMNEQSCDYREQ